MPGGMTAVEKPTCKDTRKLERERNYPHNEADAREDKNTYEFCFMERMLSGNVAFS